MQRVFTVKVNTKYPIIYNSIYDEGIQNYMIKEFTEGNINSLAEGIENWLWEFDTYEYRDIYDDRVNVAEEIKNQLKELKTLKQIIKILYAEELKEEELYNALREELKI